MSDWNDSSPCMTLVNEAWLRDALTQGVVSSCPPLTPAKVLRDGTIVQEAGACSGGSNCTASHCDWPDSGSKQ